MSWNNPRVVVATLAFGVAVGGCGPAGDDAPVAEERAAAVPALAQDIPNPDRCDEIGRRADALLQHAMPCAHDLECGVASGADLIADPCLPQLLCWMPTSTREDTAAVVTELRRLDDAYREACGSCPLAICIDPQHVTASCEQDACGLEVAMPSNDLAMLEY